MAKYAFLSNEWVGEARRIYAEAGAGEGVAESADLVPVRVNLIVTDAPFSPDPVDAHVDTSAGRLDIDVGHLPDPDVTVSLGYDTARSLFVQGDVQAVLQAFLGGRIKVDGDLSKLLDPRSGIWPASSGGGGFGAGPFGGGPSGAGPASQPAASDGGVGEGAEASPGQQGFAFGGPQALEVALRLQEITE